MTWQEFRTLLAGLGPDTPLGRIVAIRTEDDPEMLKQFSKEQKRIHSEWRNRTAKKVDASEAEQFYETMKNIFIQMAGDENK